MLTEDSLDRVSGLIPPWRQLLAHPCDGHQNAKNQPLRHALSPQLCHLASALLPESQFCYLCYGYSNSLLENLEVVNEIMVYNTQYVTATEKVPAVIDGFIIT